MSFLYPENAAGQPRLLKDRLYSVSVERQISGPVPLAGVYGEKGS